MWTRIAFLLIVAALVLEIQSLYKDKTTGYCPVPILVNKTTSPWNAYDRVAIKLAKVSCGFTYRSLPCLVELEKHGWKNYKPFCGEKERK